MRALDFGQIQESFVFALQYVPQTLILVFVPAAVCTALGMVIAVIRFWNVPVLARLLQVLVTIIKGIPIYLLLIMTNLLYILYFDAFAQWAGIPLSTATLPKIWFAVVILTIGFTPGFSEVLRGALLSVPAGQSEAGSTIGLTRLQIMRRILIPQMIPAAIPNMTSAMIGLVKASALAYTVGVTDILNAAVRAASFSYDLLEGYIAAAIIYWALSLAIEFGMGKLAVVTGRFRRTLA